MNKTHNKATHKPLKNKSKNSTRNKPKAQRKTILFFILAGIPPLAGVILAILLILTATAKPLIGFACLSEKDQQNIQQNIQTWATKNKLKFKYHIIEESSLFAPKKIQKLDLLITSSSKVPESLQTIMRQPDKEILNLMPNSMRALASNEKGQYGYPLLLDHFELAWNQKLLASTGSSQVKTISDILAAGNKIKTKTTWPLILAGSDDHILCGFIGSLTESFYGQNAWKTIQTACKTTNPQELVLQSPLKDILDSLITWRAQGILHPEWFRMSKKDVEYFMETNQALFVCMYLSDHRQIPQKIIEKYDSSFMPSLSGSANRAFTMPAITVYQPNKRPHKAITALSLYLARSEAQKTLSGQTGLAPTNAQCETSDKQASDVRLWAAASNAILPSIDNAWYSSPKDTTTLANSIRQYLEH